MTTSVISTDFAATMVVHRAAGRIDPTDVTEAMRRWYNDPGFDPDVPVLWDMRNAEFSGPPQDLTDWVAENMTEINARRPGRKTAWVLSNSDATAFLVDLLSDHDWKHRVRVFQDDIEAARAWLTSTIR